MLMGCSRSECKSVREGGKWEGICLDEWEYMWGGNKKKRRQLWFLIKVLEKQVPTLNAPKGSLSFLDLSLSLFVDPFLGWYHTDICIRKLIQKVKFNKIKIDSRFLWHALKTILISIKSTGLVQRGESGYCTSMNRSIGLAYYITTYTSYQSNNIGSLVFTFLPSLPKHYNFNSWVGLRLYLQIVWILIQECLAVFLI